MDVKKEQTSKYMAEYMYLTKDLEETTIRPRKQGGMMQDDNFEYKVVVWQKKAVVNINKEGWFTV